MVPRDRRSAFPEAIRELDRVLAAQAAARGPALDGPSPIAFLASPANRVPGRSAPHPATWFAPSGKTHLMQRLAAQRRQASRAARRPD